MTNQTPVRPHLLPLDQALHKYLTSSLFSPNNIWKIAFSPCNHYLTIPKQDFNGQNCILIIFCPNWHALSKADELYVYEELICSSAVWSLAFGQRNYTSDFMAQHRSPSFVYRLHDFTEGLFVAAGLADGKINIWNVETGQLSLVLLDHKSTVCGLTFSSNSMQLASCSHDKTIKFWNLLDDGNMYKTLNQSTYFISAVKWSPDERLLCAVGPVVLLYETLNWEKLFQLKGHEHTVVDCTFSSDSTLLATASYDTRILLWSTITGELLKVFAHLIPSPSKIYAGGDNGAFVRSVVFSKYDQFLISTCDDNQIRWFSVGSPCQSKPIFERTQPNALCVIAASDGNTMAVGTRTGEVHIWSMESIFRPLSLKESCRFLINSDCGAKRRDIVNLPISWSLINYLLHRDIRV